MCVGQSCWNCEDGVWGRGGVILKKVFCANLVEF